MKRFFSISSLPGGDVLKSNAIVFFFVLAHALVCLVMHDTKTGDGIFLAFLTIAMVYALVRFYRASLDIFLGLAFLTCFSGFYISTEGTSLLERVIPSWGVWANVVVTVLTTELLDLAVILLVRMNRDAGRKQ